MENPAYRRLLLAAVILAAASLACFPGVEMDFLSGLLPGGKPDQAAISGTRDWVLADCDCGSLEVPLNEDSSRAARLSGGLEISTIDGESVQLEPTALLVCVREQEEDLADLGWAEYFESDARGTIRYQTRIYHFPDQEQAARYFQVQETFLAENPGFCDQDPSCTVTALDFSEDYFLYITETETADSSRRHYQAGYLLGLQPTPDGVLAAELEVYHPALTVGDSWARVALFNLALCHGLADLAGDW